MSRLVGLKCTNTFQEQDRVLRHITDERVLLRRKNWAVKKSIGFMGDDRRASGRKCNAGVFSIIEWEIKEEK